MAVLKLIFSNFLTVGLLSMLFYLGINICALGSCHIDTHPSMQVADGCDFDGATVVNARLILSQSAADTESSSASSLHNRPVLSHQAGAVFGWQLQLSEPHKAVYVQEQVILPEAGQWEVSALTTISDDGRTSVTEYCDMTSNQIVENFWALSPGDPKGLYTVRLLVDGVHAETFTFMVE